MIEIGLLLFAFGWLIWMLVTSVRKAWRQRSWFRYGRWLVVAYINGKRQWQTKPQTFFTERGARREADYLNIRQQAYAHSNSTPVEWKVEKR